MTADIDNGDKGIKVLLVGNNPIEIRDIYAHIKKFRDPQFRASISFDLNKAFRRIRRFNPETILIDDRLNRKKLNRLIKRLHRNKNTKDIPVTIMKTSNQEFRIKAEVDNYVLKSNLTPELLRNTIMDSRRFRRTSIYLYKTYKKSRNFLQKIWLDLTYWY